MKKVLISAAVIVLSLSGCFEEQKEEKTQKQSQQRALPVKVFEVTNKPSTLSKTYSAVVKPYEAVDVLARVSGYLEKKHFQEGSFVKKGELLYTIEQRVYKADLQKAQANVQKAQARFKKAQKDFTRAESLIETKSISSQQFDNYEFEYADAKGALQAAKAELIQAQTNFEYTTVKAPISGVVGMKNFEIGDLVGSSSANMNLVNITATNPVYVEFSLSKEDVSRYIQQIKNKKVQVSLTAQNKTYEDGVIDYIGATLNPQTDTLMLRAKFENPQNTLIAGQFVKININNIVLENVSIIPENALLKTAKGNFVYVVKDGVAKMAPVVVGELTQSGVVIEKGLKQADKVVVSNIAKLRPDTNVQILNKE